MTQTHDVHPTDPATRLYPWQAAPSQLEQALEAARDDPSLTDLTGMLLDCPQVAHVMVDGDDERWRPTTIAVCFAGDRGTADVLSLMARAGWRPRSACFSRERITFEAIDD